MAELGSDGKKAIFGALILGFCALGLSVGPASARGIVIDVSPPNPITGCDLGGACAASNLGGAFDTSISGFDPSTPFNIGNLGNIYVYKDGVVSIGSPLPSTASLNGGLASLGHSYIAPGLADLGSLNVSVTAKVFPTELSNGTIVGNEADIFWLYNAPGSQLSILALQIIDKANGDPNSPLVGQYTIASDFGASEFSWFGTLQSGDLGATFSKLYCDVTCDNSGSDDITLGDGDQVGGTFVPTGTVTGMDLSGLGAPSATVPEPGAWLLMVGGVGLSGWRLRRRNRAARRAAANA